MNKIIYWLPRILAVLFIIFISLFALDVFEQPGWPLALLIHLIPSFVLVALTIFSWKKEKIGGYAFLLVGLLMMLFTRLESLVVSLPVIIIGILFLASEHYSKSKK